MNRMIFVMGPAALVAMLIGGCASHKATQQLVDARQAYARAETGPAAQANPAGLYEAKKALGRAEAMHKDEPGSEEEVHLAYIAQRKSILAEANARSVVAQNQAMQAQAAAEQLQKTRLANAEGKLESERQARMVAEARAKEALDKLNQFAKVKEDQRGMVITISGSVLFQTNKADLSKVARERLNGVAEALKEVQGRKILVLGHTDNTGGDDLNQKLSERRADSVRQYLVERGVPADSIRAEGRGKNEPIASNATATSRANNRRVEIIIEKAEGSTTAPPSSTTPMP